tara:strand:- start:158 stop:397 length:240 start_codon:yes stop_codon:yes gene_type:complete
MTQNLQQREVIATNLLSIISDYPDQLRVIIDELTYKLNDKQLDEIEDLIVNQYCEDEEGEITSFQEELEIKKYIKNNPI